MLYEHEMRCSERLNIFGRSHICMVFYLKKPMRKIIQSLELVSDLTKSNQETTVTRSSIHMYFYRHRPLVPRPLRHGLQILIVLHQ